MPELETDATDETTSPDPEKDQGTDVKDEIASYRKRQAGAEAARQAAEKKLADAQARLDQLEAQTRTASDQELADVAKLQERLAQAEARAKEAEAKADARILDTRFPVARAKFPEITDEVRLAELEEVFRDEVEEEVPPTPKRHNESRTAEGNAPAQKEPTYADAKAQFLGLKLPW